MTDPPLPPIAALNQLPTREFASAVRPLFEAAGPLAEALAAGRPYSSYADLIQHAETIAAQLPIEQQVQIVNGHPRIGENAAIVRRQSSLSYREQGYDREISVPAAEVERVAAELAQLSQAYEDRFGFRFVVFVNMRPKSQIVGVMRDRLRNTRSAELETARHEVFAIARDRYQRLTPQPEHR